MSDSSEQAQVAIEQLYRQESRRVFASLVRLLGDFDLAEEALQDAFAAAVSQWAKDGVPDNPRAWLISTGRFKAIDTMRRRARFNDSLEELAERLDQQTSQPGEAEEIEDDRLRLIFTCCHPAIAPETQVALTLREVCGLTTEEIASAFLSKPATIAQRIVRAKAKIRDAGIPYELPEQSQLPERLDSVLQVVYLVFNEGYSSSSGAEVTRADLSSEAIRLGRLLVELLPESEVQGLLALMLLHDSRRTARTTEGGDLVLLEDQDRSLWNRGQIRAGVELVSEAFRSGTVGPYAIQAAIAAVHAEAATPEATNWGRIVSLYGLLLRANPSAIVELNRAVAVAMLDGPTAGLELLGEIDKEGKLAGYHLLHAARADLCRRAGLVSAARKAYQQALELVQQEPERRFLEKRLSELG